MPREVTPRGDKESRGSRRVARSHEGSRGVTFWMASRRSWTCRCSFCLSISASISYWYSFSGHVPASLVTSQRLWSHHRVFGHVAGHWVTSSLCSGHHTVTRDLCQSELVFLQCCHVQRCHVMLSLPSSLFLPSSSLSFLLFPFVLPALCLPFLFPQTSTRFIPSSSSSRAHLSRRASAPCSRPDLLAACGTRSLAAPAAACHDEELRQEEVHDWPPG